MTITITTTTTDTGRSTGTTMIGRVMEGEKREEEMEERVGEEKEEREGETRVTVEEKKREEQEGTGRTECSPTSAPG